MAQLRHDNQKFINRNTQVIGLGPGESNAFKLYWVQHNLPFIGLPDPKGSVLKLYGQEVNLFKFGRMPAQVVVDKSGTARFVHYGHSMSDIPDNNEVLALLDILNSEVLVPDNKLVGVTRLLHLKKLNTQAGL